MASFGDQYYSTTVSNLLSYFVHLPSPALSLSQSLLSSFRVAELKELMKVMNTSTGGRKKELQMRADKLVADGAPNIHTHIKEIYEKHFGRRVLPPKLSPPKPPKSVSTAPAPPSYIVKYPDVKFKSYPFYQLVSTIMRPTYLGMTS